MSNNKKEQYKLIRNFFDKEAINRVSYRNDPIWVYEQKARQKAILDLIEPGEDELILDVGCGDAEDIIAINNFKSRIIGLDFSKIMIERAKVRLKEKNIQAALVIADALNLPFKNGAFDKVFASEVIEHVPDYHRAVSEMARVLKKDGVIVLTTPNKISMYGIEYLLDGIILKILHGLPSHPYDNWKTLREIKDVLRYSSLSIKDKLGICFLPGKKIYRLPPNQKLRVIKIFSLIENMARHLFANFGYMIGVSAIKNERRN